MRYRNSNKYVEKGRIIDFHNTKNIVNDNEAAKSFGVSYGEYKAGVRKEEVETEYAVNCTMFLNRTKKDASSDKVVAFIKR